MDIYDLWPVRCYTCNKVIANKQRLYEDRLQEGMLPGEILDALGLERYCCRMAALSGGKVVDVTMLKPPGNKAESKFSTEARNIIRGLQKLSISNVPTLPSSGSLQSMQTDNFIDAESARPYNLDETIDSQTSVLQGNYSRPRLLPPSIRLS